MIERAADLNRQVEKDIVARARRFDLGALLDLLRWLGYAEDDIRFDSHQTTVHQSTAIHSVRFLSMPRRSVIIVLNLGWFAPQSALPNYFMKVTAPEHEEALTTFLKFFVQQLLAAGASSLFPERNPKLFKDWSQSCRQLRTLLGLRSLSTIHWVFGVVFPEMEVSVKRTILLRTVRTRGMVLGSWRIGDGAACGGIARVPVSAILIRLVCDEPVSGNGQPWAIEALRRLREQVFPVLSAHGLFLQVELIIRDQSSFMILRRDQYLGYEPLAGAAASPAPAPKVARTIVLWTGEVPRAGES